MDFQFSLEPLQILKWVGIVFAAGFIGYFGRYLSMLIIERLHKRKGETPEINPEPSTNEATQETLVSKSSQSERDEVKLEKKRLKLEKKRPSRKPKRPRRQARSRNVLP